MGESIVGEDKANTAKKDVLKESRTAQAKAQKFPGLTRNDIEMRLTSLDKIIGKNTEMKRDIVEVAPNTFKIENNYS